MASARSLSSRLLPASPWWTASPWSSPSPASCRTVTDITYYKEVDSSHLQLVEAQSSLRKFKLKLKERELEKERLRKLKERHTAAMAQAAAPAAPRAAPEPIAVPTYVERRPGEIMRVIASHVGTDYTAPNYVFQVGNRQISLFPTEFFNSFVPYFEAASTLAILHIIFHELFTNTCGIDKSNNAARKISLNIPYIYN